jgi:branched-chain amino acid transport system ATP-binding protein
MKRRATTVLRLEDVTVAYGPVTALHSISLSVGEGELVAILGANGAGKSTLLRTISGLHESESGGVWIDGTAVGDMKAEKIARLGVAHVPEGRKIFPGLTVEQNLILGASARRDPGELSTDFERVYALFPMLRDRSKQSGWSLSGGQQQMLALGRALMGRPRLLMLDEPSLGLAPIPVREVLTAIRQIALEGTATVLVEQNARAALRIADRAYVLQNGVIVHQGTANELKDDPGIRASYLGV